ncbi:hypothetical protein EJ110_NYTH27919 [Nymphaea thermarum]|nr:hypothetical protein EJ110_NYTH27919 [Nymphaea thermarum]
MVSEPPRVRSLVCEKFFRRPRLSCHLRCRFSAPSLSLGSTPPPSNATVVLSAAAVPPLFPAPPPLFPAPPPSSAAAVQRLIPKIDDALDTGCNTKSENLPVHVTSIRLNKDNYLSWSAALEIGITSRGRLHYITGERPASSKTDPQWATWALEDSKVWIISSVSADIQPLILRKSAAYDMWTVLARMYGHQALYWEKEWMDRTFIFLGGLHDEFESIQSQILNCDEIPRIEEVYACVESEEQRRQIMHIDPNQGKSPTAFVSHTSGTRQRPTRRCNHCNKVGHSVDFCWDLHLEKRLIWGRPPPNRRAPSVPEPISSPSVEDAVSKDRDSQMEGDSVVEQSRDHLFGQVYNRKKKDVMENVHRAHPVDLEFEARGVLKNLVSAPQTSCGGNWRCRCTRSRLPNLGVLGKAECLSLELTNPWMSALPLQRMDGSILFWATTGVVSRL